MNTDTNIPLSAKVEIWRQKAIDGTLTIEEAKEAVAAIRQGRVAAAQTSAKAAAKKNVTVNIDDLMGGLESL